MKEEFQTTNVAFLNLRQATMAISLNAKLKNLVCLVSEANIHIGTDLFEWKADEFILNVNYFIPYRSIRVL